MSLRIGQCHSNRAWRKLGIASFAWAVISVGGAANATLPSESMLFTGLDKNKDGFVTEDEVPQEHIRLYQRLLRTGDKDGDKKLSRDEFEAGLAKKPEPEANANRPEGFRPDARTIEEMFKRGDRNGDGKLSKDELPEERRDMFQRLLDRFDDDRDGALTLEQFTRGMSGMFATGRPNEPKPESKPELKPESKVRQPEKQSNSGNPGIVLNPTRSVRQVGDFTNRPPLPIVMALDLDGDGEISPEEIASAAKSLAKLDKDGNGRLTRDEFLPIPMALARPNSPENSNPPNGVKPKTDSPQPNIGNRPLLKNFDKNGDGKLSRDEAPEFLKRFFDRADQDGDGFLSEDELRSVAQRAGVQRKPND